MESLKRLVNLLNWLTVWTHWLVQKIFYKSTNTTWYPNVVTLAFLFFLQRPEINACHWFLAVEEDVYFSFFSFPFLPFPDSAFALLKFAYFISHFLLLIFFSNFVIELSHIFYHIIMWDTSDLINEGKLEFVLTFEHVFTIITLYFMEVNSLWKLVNGVNVKI